MCARSAALISLMIVSGWSASAHAFCRATTCDPTVDDCTAPPGHCVEKGMPLYWAGECVSYDLAAETPQGISYDAFSKTVQTAFTTWSSAPCGDAGSPTIHVRDLGPIDCPRVEFNPSSGNFNAIFFHTKQWPYDLGALALTSVTFNIDTGEIVDVDMEINAVSNAITVGDVGVHFDLESIVTHEGGHFLGLGHSPVAEATMYVTDLEGSTSLRTLAADDIDGICTVYPPGRVTTGCDPTPRNGMDTCGAGGASGGGDDASIDDAAWVADGSADEDSGVQAPAVEQPGQSAGGCGCRTARRSAAAGWVGLGLCACAIAIRRTRRHCDRGNLIEHSTEGHHEIRAACD